MKKMNREKKEVKKEVEELKDKKKGYKKEMEESKRRVTNIETRTHKSDTADGTATTLWVEWSGVQFPVGVRKFLISKRIDRLWSPHSFLSHGYREHFLHCELYFLSHFRKGLLLLSPYVFFRSLQIKSLGVRVIYLK
jgi:hypothetical protein